MNLFQELNPLSIGAQLPILSLTPLLAKLSRHLVQVSLSVRDMKSEKSLSLNSSYFQKYVNNFRFYRPDSTSFILVNFITYSNKLLDLIGCMCVSFIYVHYNLKIFMVHLMFFQGCPIVQVDGYVEHSTPENLIKRRFCLGALTNLQGKEVCEITRQHIGK